MRSVLAESSRRQDHYGPGWKSDTLVKRDKVESPEGKENIVLVDLHDQPGCCKGRFHQRE